MQRYFVTGTDTDCGKTYVTGQLVDSFANALAVKPVASGWVAGSSDAELINRSKTWSIKDINPWQFSLPVSPHIAACHEGVTLHIDEIADFCLNFNSESHEILFIEGAGGLMVPLNNNQTWLDFLKLTQIPVILVVGMRLGCINHALLTHSVLIAHNISVVGWIANCLDPKMLALEENIRTLCDLLTIPRIGSVPFNGQLELEMSLSI